MSVGSQVSAFCKDVAKSKTLWAVKFDDGDYLMWGNEDDSDVFPIWSTENRVKRSLRAATEISGGTPVTIPFDLFLEKWLPDFIEGNIAIGPNWAGPNLTGTSFEANELIDRVKRTAGF